MATTEEATSFLDFQEEFNRSYDTPEELAYRSGVYIDNLNLINANNNNATSNFIMAVNDFSDLTLAEFQAIYLGYAPRRQESSAMENGFMGGPFVSLTTLDKKRNRVVTIEGYVFAPKFKKRDYIKEVEAIIYSTKFLE